MIVCALIKFEGEDIVDGVLGARDSINALEGFDTLMRGLLEREIPELKSIQYDIPVKIQEGSWELSIPENIFEIAGFVKKCGIPGLIGVSLFAYIMKTATIAADKGLLETGLVRDLKKVIPFVFEKIVWLVRYVKHLGCFEKRPDVAFTDESKWVVIKNKEGGILRFPLECLEFVQHCPKNALDELVTPVNKKRRLRIAYKKDGQWHDECINDDERRLFVEEPSEENELPELVDGQVAVVEGLIVRANEKDQSIGLQYHDHVVTCKPGKGLTLASFKAAIISGSSGRLYQTNVRITGLVERVTVDGRYKTKPRIFINEMEPVDDGVNGMLQESLF